MTAEIISLQPIPQPERSTVITIEPQPNLANDSEEMLAIPNSLESIEIEETERLTDFHQPHQSRVPDFDLVDCETLHTHYMTQLATCNAQARPVIQSFLTRLEAQMEALLG